MKLKCNFDLPETEKPCRDKKSVEFDEDPINRPHEIIEVKRKY